VVAKIGSQQDGGSVPARGRSGRWANVSVLAALLVVLMGGGGLGLVLPSVGPAAAVALNPAVRTPGGAPSGPSSAIGPVSVPSARFVTPPGPGLLRAAAAVLAALPSTSPAAAGPVEKPIIPAPAPRGPGPGGAFPVAGQEGWVVIPRIGLAVAVFEGGQSVIDRGVAAHYDGPGWRPPVAAGQGGTYWLAAHHVTHGAPFLRVPDLRAGDVVEIVPASGAPTVTYRVTSVEVVGVTASYLTVYGPDTTTPRLLLQTCEGDSARLLVHGVLA